MNYNAIEAETFLERLRNTTAQSHKNLEDLPVSISITNPAVTKTQYTHYLSLMHDIVKDAENNVFPLLKGVLSNPEEYNKSYMLENDLAALNYYKSEYKKPLSSKLKNPSEAFALGIMYVIEGSTLGGRVILKNITENLKYDAQHGAQYFAGYGNSTGSKWKSFINLMVKYEEENKNAEEIIAGANFAFNTINEHFTQNAL